jgi:hypothetical protein
MWPFKKKEVKVPRVFTIYDEDAVKAILLLKDKYGAAPYAVDHLAKFNLWAEIAKRVSATKSGSWKFGKGTALTVVIEEDLSND